MMRAVMEGVAYSLSDCYDILKGMGVNVAEMMACGGGGKSPVWRQMLADMFQGIFFIHTFRASEVRHEDDGASAFQHLLDGRHGCPHPGVVRDFKLVVQRHIEVYANQCPFALEVVSVNCLHTIIVNGLSFHITASFSR